MGQTFLFWVNFLYLRTSKAWSVGGGSDQWGNRWWGDSGLLKTPTRGRVLDVNPACDFSGVAYKHCNHPSGSLNSSEWHSTMMYSFHSEQNIRGETAISSPALCI